MLLRWVLTRDRTDVLTMADAYGTVQVEGDRVTRVRPESWDDASRTHSINESLPAEEKIRTAVIKANMEIIPAQKEIYSSLRRGALDSWARPNGSGDIVLIRPIDWTGLRFHSLDGRDIAIPVDSEYNPLRLPHPLAEYLTGTIPATTTPTAWPDPLFSAEQAIKLWPPYEPNAATSRSEQGPSESAKALHEFDVRLGWIRLTAAVEIIGSVAGDLAWQQVKQAIQRKALLARCRADGVTCDLEPHWIDFLAWDRPDGDVLWFDREKAWRAFARPVDRTAVPVPDRTEDIVVPIARCAELWPGCAWPGRGVAKRILEGAPSAPATPADSLSGGTDVFGRPVEKFVVGDQHTVFEWCMIYTDRHPAGAHPNHNHATVEHMRSRLVLLGACGRSDEVTRISNAVYRELVAAIEAGRIELRKRVYLDDRPAELDLTLCVIGPDPVLEIARRHQDGGQKIAELLARHDRAGGNQVSANGNVRPRASDTDVREWYKEIYIPKCIKDGKQPSEDLDWTAARAKFGNRVRRQQVRDVRHELAPDDWRRQGRRGSSPNSAD